ncbi:MAG: PAS domain S-box protein [Sulfuriferula sp.]|nr:PAS domain S-box protein [Sulfuriferula sp.]
MSLIAIFQDMIVRRKLTVIAILSAGVALLFAAVVSTTQQWVVYRSELINTVNSNTGIVSINSAAALQSRDKTSAQATLNALQTIDYIDFAAIEDNDGKLFAIYMHPSRAPTPLRELLADSGQTFSTKHIDLYRPVMFGGKRIGTIHVQASLLPVYQQLIWNLMFMLAVMLIGLGMVWALIVRMQPNVTGPIERLLELMRTVSRDRNYALRADVPSKDEVGMLANAFNDMLEQIQLRDNELEQHRAELEREVALRTGSLVEAQRIAHLGNWEWDVVQDKLSWSDEIYHIFGLAPQQFGANYEAFMQAVHADDRQHVEQQVRNALTQGHAFSIDHRILRPDGSLRYVRERGEVLCGEDGQAIKVLGTVHDVTDSWLTEMALAANEKRFRDLVEQSSDWIWEADAQGIYTYVSPQCRTVLGYEPEEIIGKTPFDFMPQPEAERLLPVFMEIAQSQQPFSRLENINIRKDGRQIVLETSGVPIFDQNKAFRGYRGMDRDISERKLAETALRKQQELTSQIIETIPIRVFWKDRDLQYLGCNTLFAKDAGLSSPDELIGKNDFDMTWKNQAELYRADDLQVMNSGIPKLSYDELQTTPDGGSIWLRTSKVPLRNSAHETIGMLGIYEDITEYKKMELHLLESEERFRRVVDTARDAIISINGETDEITAWNPAAETIFGYSREEAVGQLLHDFLMPARFREAAHRGLTAFALSGEGAAVGTTQELVAVRKNGDEFPIELSLSAMQVNGKWFATGIARDITDRKLIDDKIRKLNEELEIKVEERTRQLLDAQEELVRKEKLAVLGQVAGSVGHELRNPLGVMSNAVYFLQTVLPDADDTTREYLGIIKNEIGVADRIVGDLLDSVRTKPPQPQIIAAANLIDQVLRKCDVPANVVIRQDIPDMLPALRVDPMQVGQVLRNLISNGIEAMQDGGELTIRASADPAAQTLVISVQDTGVGMTPEQLSRLFQPLFTTKPKGIGLGLVVVKNLTQSNGGKVEVASEPGRGTTFTVTLPTAGSPENTV